MSLGMIFYCWMVLIYETEFCISVKVHPGFGCIIRPTRSKRYLCDLLLAELINFLSSKCHDTCSIAQHFHSAEIGYQFRTAHSSSLFFCFYCKLKTIDDSITFELKVALLRFLSAGGIE